MTKKIIIDTDPGIDDALAIVFAAHHPDIDLLGLTCVFGNVPVTLATENALRLVELIDQDIPVCSGAAKPLLITPHAHPDFVHGKNGFGEVESPAPTRRALSSSSAEFIVQQVRAAPGEVYLVPIGPLTNIALALQMAPDIAKKTAGVILMGGAAIEPGNVTPVAEANIWNDPHAAEVVFAADWPVTMVGLDATHKTTLDQAFFDQAESSAPRQGKFLNQIHQFYLDFYATKFNERTCAAHDALAVLTVVAEELLTFETGAIAVSCEGVATGQTLFAPAGKYDHDAFWSNRPKHRVAMGVDAPAIKALFLETLKNAS